MILTLYLLLILTLLYLKIFQFFLHLQIILLQFKIIKFIIFSNNFIYYLFLINYFFIILLK